MNFCVHYFFSGYRYCHTPVQVVLTALCQNLQQYGSCLTSGNSSPHHWALQRQATYAHHIKYYNMQNAYFTLMPFILMKMVWPVKNRGVTQHDSYIEVTAWGIWLIHPLLTRCHLLIDEFCNGTSFFHRNISLPCIIKEENSNNLVLVSKECTLLSSAH